MKEQKPPQVSAKPATLEIPAPAWQTVWGKIHQQIVQSGIEFKSLPAKQKKAA